MKVDYCTGPLRAIIDEAAHLLHVERNKAKANAFVGSSAGQVEINPQVEGPINDEEHLQVLLRLCLDSNYYSDAAKLLWPPQIFTPEPEATRRVWNAIERGTKVMLMGAASMSKTYGAGVEFFLDWLADPEYTTVKVVGPSEQHLQDNLFSHLVDLHRNSAITLPGKIGDLFIGLDMRSRRSSIQGTVIPIGKKAAGRLQGMKRFPRMGKPHPRFGTLSRLRILMDEVENIPAGIWSDLDNVSSNTGGLEGLKIVGSFNPKDPGGHCGIRCEPVGGWQTKDIDKDFEWKSRRGWDVVRLDAYQSENYKARRVIFPGLQTYEGANETTKNGGGPTSASHYTFVRAWFPTAGSSYAVIPSMLLDLSKGVPIWYNRPKRVTGGDIALTGGDAAVLCHGLLGDAVGVRFAPSLRYPKGQEFMFKDGDTQKIRRLLYLDKLEKLPPARTSQMAKTIHERCVEIGTAPEDSCFDRTGHGAGVADLLTDIWSAAVPSVNYSESATDWKYFVEDTKMANEECDRIVTELWFGMKKVFEFGTLIINPELETINLFDQLRNRQYEPGVKNKVESKRDYKARGFSSPDEADGLSLFVRAGRKANGEPFVGLWKPSEKASSEDGDEDADHYHRVDVTNTQDSL